MLWAWADMSLLTGISRDADVDKIGLIQHWHKSENAVCLAWLVETDLNTQDVI
jgi:hypothetical protein